MKDLDYNEYLFAILHFEAYVKDTDTPLDDAFELYLSKYQKYLKSDVSKNYSLSDYEAMTRFLGKEV
jgi:hypothetical protein